MAPPTIHRAMAAGGTELSPPLWKPLPGPQSEAYASQADIIGYGGAAGGGKSSYLVGTAVMQHLRSIIFRRESPQFRDIIDYSEEVLSGLPGATFNRVEKVWRLPGRRLIEFGSVQYEEDKRKYRGRAHDLCGFDEATEFSESQVRFLMGWLRTTVPNQRCKVVLTFNPPSSEEGWWVVRWFAPWLDPTHHNPARPGELRWYAMVGGEEMERPDSAPFAYRNGEGVIETITPTSRTFIPARLEDNPYLLETGYGRQLDALPEPLRSMLRRGDFQAAIVADRWQLIPLSWIQAANRRWEQMARGDPGPQTCLGVDVAHGGADSTVVAARHGPYVARLVVVPGRLTPSGGTAAAEVAKVWDGAGYINVDAIGYGASCAERLIERPPDGYGYPARAVNVAQRSGTPEAPYTDRSGKFRMTNLRAEMYWRLREELDPDLGATLCLPPDRELTQELTSHRYEVTPSGIKIEEKARVAERLGRSPDRSDSVALTCLPYPRQFGAASIGGYRPLPGGRL